MEQLETETDNDIDMRGFSERLKNDKRPPKPTCKPAVIMQSFFTSPPLCTDYIAMSAATTDLTKPHLTEVRGIIPEKKKTPRGWPPCLKRSSPKARFHNNDIYVVHTNEDEHHYEEPKEKES